MNELGEESHVTCDNDDKNEENNLEERITNINTVLENEYILNDVLIVYLIQNYLKKGQNFYFTKFRHMSNVWKSYHYMNYGNNISNKKPNNYWE